MNSPSRNAFEIGTTRGHLESLAEVIRPDTSIPGGHCGMDFGNQGVAQLDPPQRSALTHAGKTKKFLFGWSLLIPFAKFLQGAPDQHPARVCGLRARRAYACVCTLGRSIPACAYGFGHIHAYADRTPPRTVRFFTPSISPA